MQNFRYAVMAGCVAIFFFLGRVLNAQAPPLAQAGCPMAHCTPHLSDAVNAVIPDQGSLVAADAQSGGAKIGLGCSSNLVSVVACTFASDAPPDLIAYNGDGKRIFADTAGVLDNNANKS